MNVQEAIDLFLEHCRHGRNLSTHTLRAYTIDLRIFSDFVGGGLGVDTCEREKLRTYLAHLYDLGLKETSIKRRIACLKAMFSWMEDDGYLDPNPFHRMKLRIKMPVRLPRSLSKTEVSKLLHAPAKNLGVRGAQDYANLKDTKLEPSLFRELTALMAVELLIHTGMRVGELERVKITDINFSDSTISIIGKGDRQRKVIITDVELAALLQAYISQRTNYRPTTEALLITNHARNATTQYIRRLVAEAGGNARVERRVTPHMLRHTAATQYLESGVDIRYVQHLLGHRSISTTQIYTNVSECSLRESIKNSGVRKGYGHVTDN